MRVSTRQSHDVDEQATLLRGWNQSYQQLSAGTFSGTLAELDLGDIRIMREFTSHALHQTGSLPDDWIALGLPLRAPARPFFCGRLCDEDRLLVFSGSDAFDFHSPGRLDILDFVIHRSTLHQRVADAAWLASWQQPRAPHLRQLPPGLRWKLQQLASDAFGLRDQESHGSPDPGMAETSGICSSALRTELIETLIQTLQAGDAPETTPSRPRQVRIVEQARALMRDNGAETPLSIHDICLHLGIARRTLQYAFQEVLGTSPHQYLRAWRLNGARQAIKQQQRIADAATAWGFWHFGKHPANPTLAAKLPA